jgi:hypothetical protein
LILCSDMTDDIAPTPEISSEPAPPTPARARRAASPRAKKAVAVISPEEPAAADQASIPFPASSPASDESPADGGQAGDDWPEPEVEAAGAPVSQSESAKRKRRRRKGKGKSHEAPQSAAEVTHEEPSPLPSPEARAADFPHEPRPKTHAPQPAPVRPRIDPELLTKMAWKIYLAEVSEEGVALIGDQDAKDLSRRCFRLAEIFIEEQSRRREKCQRAAPSVRMRGGCRPGIGGM